MNCPICETELEMQVSVIIKCPSSMEGLMSKSNFRKKEVQILGVDWDRASYVCTICGFAVLGKY